MRKTEDHDPASRTLVARIARRPSGKSRGMPDEGVTITSGARVPQIDLTNLLRQPADGASVSGGMSRAVPGGAQVTPAAASGTRTVALSDGTRIVFAAASPPHELEPA